MNRIQLMGYLVQDPEIKTQPNDGEMASLSLALHESWKDAKGGWKKKTEWHHVTVFKPSIVIWLREKIKTGDLLFVQGSLSYGEKEDSPTKKKKATHIVVEGQTGQIFRICKNNDQPNLKPPIPITLETSNDNE